MHKTKVVEQKKVETETTQTNSPQVEKPITGAETTGEVSDVQGTATENLNEPVLQTEEERRAFQEMRLENKRLKEALGTKDGESAFDAFRTQIPANNPSPQVDPGQYQDPISGNVDWNAYNLAQQAREQKMVQQAKFEAQQVAQEITDENNARTKYPEIMSDFELEREVADKWLASKMRGENLTITSIAERVAKRNKQTVSKAEKIGAEKILNEVTEKEKATMTPESQTSGFAQQVANTEDQTDLSYRTRLGDHDAVVTRLSKIPWANK
jgi:hypothetical protein